MASLQRQAPSSWRSTWRRTSPIRLWASYQQRGHLAEYARGVADFLRAFSEPSLFGGIAAERSPQAAAKLADEFYGQVRDAVAQQPAKAQCTWRLVLLRLAKR